MKKLYALMTNHYEPKENPYSWRIIQLSFNKDELLLMAEYIKSVQEYWLYVTVVEIDETIVRNFWPK